MSPEDCHILTSVYGVFTTEVNFIYKVEAAASRLSHSYPHCHILASMYGTLIPYPTLFLIKVYETVVDFS